MADPAVVVPLYLLAVAVLVPVSFAAGIALGKARVAANVRRHGGRVRAIRYVWTPALFRTRRGGYHVDLVDAHGRHHQARAYPGWGKVFWRQGDQAFSLAQGVQGTLLDAQWWTTPLVGPPGPQPAEWLPADSPPTVRRHRMWYVPVAFGAFFLLTALTSFRVAASVVLASGSLAFLALPGLAAVVGLALLVYGLGLRR